MAQSPSGKGDRASGRGLKSRARATFWLRDWCIEPRLNRIKRDQETHQIEPKLMDLLVALASQPGEVFTREELLDLVWPEVVVGEEVLTRGISELRRLLGDDSRRPRYIETIRKGGYRIVSSVRPTKLGAATTAPGEGPDVPPTGEDQVRSEVQGRRTRTGILRPAVWWIAVAVILAVAAGLYSVLTGGHGDAGQGGEIFRPRPLTAYPGNEVTPALSPDGRLVAFSWDGVQGNNYDLYLLQIGAASPLRLTDDPAVDIHPVWSPDGMTIAYIHDEGAGAEIRIVPALGGASRRIIDAPLGLGGGFSWSPDGTQIVYATRTRADRSTQIFLHDLDSATDTPLTPARRLGRDDTEPKFSPDGTTIAYLRSHISGFEDLWVVSRSGGAARCVRPALLQVMGIAWTSTGGGLLCSALHEGSFSLWRIDLSDGGISWSSVLGDWIYTPSVARQGERMVYHHYRHERNIWRAAWVDPEYAEMEPIIVSSHWDSDPSISPDGRHIAYTSTRSGTLELWACRSDGSRPEKITAFNGCVVARPRWSPDGDQIAFQANPGGSQQVYLVEFGGGKPWPVPLESTNMLLSDWSLDGRWLYFSREMGDQWDLWRIDPTAVPARDPMRVTADGGIRGCECADGYFYYAKPDRAGLWRLPLRAPESNGQRNAIMLPKQGRRGSPCETEYPRLGEWNAWTVCGHQVVWVIAGKEGAALVRYDPGSGENVFLARLPELGSSTVALYPGCLGCLYSRVEDAQGDLMLVEGFR